jgi:hypothetical protein
VANQYENHKKLRYRLSSEGIGILRKWLVLDTMSAGTSAVVGEYPSREKAREAAAAMNRAHAANADYANSQASALTPG